MTLAETIYRHSLRLPEHAAREALDFIELLERRYAHVGTSPVQGPKDEADRQDALNRPDQVRIARGGKPIPDRDALYEERRGG